MFYENANRNYKIFEKFTYYMISLAQSNRVSKPFALNENIYVFDSTMMDLRINLFEWTYFKKAKNGIKVHTLFDMVTQIPTYVYTTRARLHDVKAIDEVSYESNVFHIFNKEY